MPDDRPERPLEPSEVKRVEAEAAKFRAEAAAHEAEAAKLNAEAAVAQAEARVKSITADREDHKTFEQRAKPINPKTTKAFIKRHWTRRDWSMSAQDALKFGFVDEIT